MLSTKGEGGGQGQRPAGRPSQQQDYNQGGSYEEPVFNPDDEIPF